MRSERHEKLVGLVRERSFITTEELCALLNASQATVRRDIAELDRQGRLSKTHGGAMAAVKPATDDMPMDLRMHMQREEKGRIAQAAAGLVAEGESVFLDSGTTTFELAVRLCEFKRLTILTNDIHIAYEVSRSSVNTLIVAGGVRKKGSATLMGVFTEQMLSELHVDLAFLSVDAVDPEAGFMDYNTDEIPLKRLMLANSRRHIVLCDHTKFDNAAFMSICPLGAAGLAITGKELPEDAARRYREAGLELMTV